MNKKLFRTEEIVAPFVTFGATILLWNIYKLSGNNLLWALFGSVNFSVWEQLKPIIFTYLFLGLVELISSRPDLRQFTVAKFVGVYSLILSYISIKFLFYTEYNNFYNIFLALPPIFISFFISYKMTKSDYPFHNLFPTACFMLLILFILSLSLTAFPPKTILFMDPATTLYGIIPDYIDVGAILLNDVFLN